jgi:hypothetical protein
MGKIDKGKVTQVAMDSSPAGTGEQRRLGLLHTREVAGSIPAAPMKAPHVEAFGSTAQVRKRRACRK